MQTSCYKRDNPGIFGVRICPRRDSFHAFEYDHSGDRTATVEDHGVRVEKTRSENASTGLTYEYDESDNVESRTLAGSSDAETFTLDDDGNMTSRTVGSDVTSYSWDDFDRLIAVEKPDDSKVVNPYDSGSLRKERVFDNGEKVKSFLSGLPTSNESSSNGNSFSYLVGHQLMGFEDQSGNFRYFVTDGLSSVRLVLNSSGTTGASFEHDEFGNELAAPGSSPKTYVGGLGVQDDTEKTDLLYTCARHYDPTLGRFLNRDPIGFVGGLNMFTYAHGNPASFTDASGLHVEGELNVSTGKLVLRDIEVSGSGERVERGTYEFDVFSGNGAARNDITQQHLPDVGPIPTGRYYIGDMVDLSNVNPLEGDLEWFPLLDAATMKNEKYVIDPQTGKRVKRTAFFLHPGLISAGCITFPSETDRSDPNYPFSANYQKLKALLNSTSPLRVPAGPSTSRGSFLPRYRNVRGFIVVR